MNATQNAPPREFFGKTDPEKYVLVNELRTVFLSAIRVPLLVASARVPMATDMSRFLLLIAKARRSAPSCDFPG